MFPRRDLTFVGFAEVGNASVRKFSRVARMPGSATRGVLRIGLLETCSRLDRIAFKSARAVARSLIPYQPSSCSHVSPGCVLAKMATARQAGKHSRDEPV